MTEFRQKGFGDALRRRREELRLSLDDLAASTRIRKTYLQALEEENLSVLPGAAYTLGFLRIYARQLGLAVEPLLAALEGGEAKPERADLPAAGRDQLRTAKKGVKSRKPARLLALLAILLAVAAVYVYFRTGEPAPPAVPVAVAPRPSPLPAAERPPQIDAQASPAPASSPAASEQSAPAVAELPLLPAGGAVVRMLPVAAGLMKVSLDNQELREYQLQPDQSLNWKVAASLACELSAPGLVRVWVDQQEVAVAEYPAFILRSVSSQEQRP